MRIPDLVEYAHRMFYYLPNKRPIDTEGAIDAMLDENRASRYFLDTETGDVGCIDDDVDPNDSKLAAVVQRPNRYRELPHIHREAKSAWLQEFINEIILHHAPALARRLSDALHTKGFEGAYALLESSPGDWVLAWEPWEGDSTFEALGEWLSRHVQDVAYEWKGCDECAICRASKDGASIEELREAFDEQRAADDESLEESGSSS